jgi:hypothetical protein
VCLSVLFCDTQRSDPGRQIQKKRFHFSDGQSSQCRSQQSAFSPVWRIEKLQYSKPMLKSSPPPPLHPPPSICDGVQVAAALSKGSSAYHDAQTRARCARTSRVLEVIFDTRLDRFSLVFSDSIHRQWAYPCLLFSRQRLLSAWNSSGRILTCF